MWKPYSLKLHLIDMEDRSHRNNLCLWGLPEVTGDEDLADTVIAIFLSIGGVELPDLVALDRIHRALGPRPTDPARPPRRNLQAPLCT